MVEEVLGPGGQEEDKLLDGIPLPMQVVPDMQMGRFVRPLVDQLNALPEKDQREAPWTLDMTYGFFRDKDVPALDFTRQDVWFLLTDRVGDLIRKPLICHTFARKLEEASKPKMKLRGR